MTQHETAIPLPSTVIPLEDHIQEVNLANLLPPFVQAEDFPVPDAFLLSDWAFPDEDTIKRFSNEFRFWHVEALLNQSANLIDKCVADLAEFKRLEMLEFTVSQELELARELLRDEQLRRRREIDATIHSIWHQKNAKSNHDSAASVGSKGEVARAYQLFAENLDRQERLDQSEQYLEELKSDILDNDKLFQFKNEQLARKLSKFTGTDTALDIQYQMGLCFSRFSRNFDDALKRSIIAQKGLEAVYGRVSKLDPLAVADTPLDIQKRLSTLYDWIYEAIEFISAYSQLDQGFTVCFSLKSVLTDLESQRLSSRDSFFEEYFSIDHNLFPIQTHSNIRLKGIAASLIGNVGHIPWTIEMGLPESCVYNRVSEEGEVVYTIEHSSRMSCILGRVENRNSPRPVEFGGAVSLNNLSPLGVGEGLKSLWSARITKPIGVSSETFSNIEDIVIELALVGRLMC